MLGQCGGRVKVDRAADRADPRQGGCRRRPPGPSPPRRPCSTWTPASPRLPSAFAPRSRPAGGSTRTRTSGRTASPPRAVPPPRRSARYGRRPRPCRVRNADRRRDRDDPPAVPEPNPPTTRTRRRARSARPRSRSSRRRSTRSATAKAPRGSRSSALLSRERAPVGPRSDCARTGVVASRCPRGGRHPPTGTQASSCPARRPDRPHLRRGLPIRCGGFEALSGSWSTPRKSPGGVASQGPFGRAFRDSASSSPHRSRHAFRSSAGSLPRASASRTPARSESCFQWSRF